ncbi:MAG: TIGR02301 family protein [Phenylobacterium sp.]|uniref:TIGR02301 family protein n=1 Tax=Phenylobacterium sp. TaxID=1871053 RepID=UPI00391DFCB8
MKPALIAILALAAAPAAAQTRGPVERQALVDLSYVLGESHALRQACEGEDDQYWRARMIRLVELEAPDESLDRRLRTAFNTGYSTARAAHPRCDAAGRAEAARAAVRGRALALRLSQAVDPPDTIAGVTRPR